MGINVKLVTSERGYALDEWIKHEIESDLDSQIIELNEELTAINTQAQIVKSKLEEALKTKEAMEKTIKYLVSRK